MGKNVSVEIVSQHVNDYSDRLLISSLADSASASKTIRLNVP